MRYGGLLGRFGMELAHIYYCLTGKSNELIINEFQELCKIIAFY